jgi:hypothetical protein
MDFLILTGDPIIVFKNLHAKQCFAFAQVSPMRIVEE